MSSYIKVTLTKSAPVVITYQCSACGAENKHPQKIDYQRQFEVRGIGRASRDKAELLDVEYGFEMQEGLIDTIASIQDPANPHRYDKAKFSCCCSACGHREPWAKLGKIKILKSIKIIAVLCIFTAIFVNGKLDLELLGNLLLALGIAGFVSCPIITLVNKQIQKKKIKELATESLPVVIPLIKMEKRKKTIWDEC